MSDRVPTADELRRKYVHLSRKVITGARVADSTNDIDTADLRASVQLTAHHVAGVARLLIRKGVITESEYWQSQIDAIQGEVSKYEDEIGPGITLA